MKLIIIAVTKDPIDTLVISLINPFPVKREEAIGENSVKVHAIEIRKNSAMLFTSVTFVTLAIKTQSFLHYIESVYIPLNHQE